MNFLALSRRRSFLFLACGDPRACFRCAVSLPVITQVHEPKTNSRFVKIISENGSGTSRNIIKNVVSS